MEEKFSRTALLLGETGVEKLKNSRVAVFGLGGVGSFCAEALVRAGVGKLTFIDKDIAEESNLNRQLVALRSTLGVNKAQIMKARAQDIFPETEATALECFYLPETANEVPLNGFDYIADCIDNVTGKILLIERAISANVPIISAMGAGNRLDPTRIRIADISETKICPLARVMRHELKRRGITRLTVAYSEEEPQKAQGKVGSVSFVPSVMGLVMAGKIVRELVK